MCNMRALSLLVRKICPRLKFLSKHTRRRGPDADADARAMTLAPRTLIPAH